MGYGSRAIQALNSYFSGEYFSLDEEMKDEAEYPDVGAVDPVRVSSLPTLPHPSSADAR
jgi:N-acetyltransferase 10